MIFVRNAIAVVVSKILPATTLIGIAYINVMRMRMIEESPYEVARISYKHNKEYSAKNIL